jgi:hypothetical protein
MSSLKTLLILALIVSLFACGGGGSEAPAETQPLPPTAQTPPVPVSPVDPALPELKKFWTFAVHKDPLITLRGKDYASFVSDFHAEDFNGDGHIDLLLGGPTWDISDDGLSEWSADPFKFDVLRGTPEGFVEDTSMLFGEGFVNDMVHLTDILPGDYDGNGTVDLIFTGNGHDVFESFGDRVYYFTNPGNMPLVNSNSKLNFDTRAFFHSASVGDFNGDGHLEPQMWQSSDGPNLTLETSGVILINDGNGTFVRNTEIVSEKFLPEYIQELKPGVGSWNVLDNKAFDLNNSGCSDLVLGSMEDSHPSMILWNNCEGLVSEPAVYADNVPIGTYIIPAVTGFELVIEMVEYPLNEDDYIDLSIIRTSKDYQGNYIQFLRNNGDQTFTDVTESTVTQSSGPKWHNKAYVHDFDKDGFMDMVFTVDNGFEDKNVTDVIWRGTAAGIEQVELDWEDVNGSLVVIDVNSDGNMDILVRKVFNFGRESQYIEYRLLENIAK